MRRAFAGLLAEGDPGRPRRHDGAPLRRRLLPGGRKRRSPSSPSSRRGSIAAGMAGTLLGSPHLSSPSSRRGSIAAHVNPQAAPCVTDGRPRRHDGAPLRHDGRVTIRRSAPGRPRRHDGAPLRPAFQQRPILPASVVVPVVTTGLHCGLTAIDEAIAALAGSSPSSRRGSIAASVAERVSLIAAAGRPRRHDGAPLRLGSSARATERGSVVPVVTTGLHCGPRAPAGRPLGTKSSPSSRRGSIAARVVEVVKT